MDLMISGLYLPIMIDFVTDLYGRGLVYRGNTESSRSGSKASHLDHRLMLDARR
jgi:hypothetical protein